MKNSFRTLCVVAVATLLSANVSAQDSTRTSIVPQKTNAGKSGAKPTWIVGIHGVAVDDDGEYFTNLFNASGSWNYLPYPTRVTVERSLNKAWRIEGAASYTQYKAGKLVNDGLTTKDDPFFALDFNAKYDLNALFGETSVFDPYTVTGLGFTYRPALEEGQSCPTVNLGIGFNIWIYQGFGLNLQSTAKFKILPASSNYLMHSVGIVYQIGYIKDAEPKKGSIREVR